MTREEFEAFRRWAEKHLRSDIEFDSDDGFVVVWTNGRGVGVPFVCFQENGTVLHRYTAISHGRTVDDFKQIIKAMGWAE